MNRSNISVLTVLVSLLGLGKAFGQEDFGQPVVYANNSATVMGQVSINGEAAGEGDVVAIYVGDELRCKQAVAINGGVAWLPNALVNAKGGEETITFKIYDSSADEVLDKIRMTAVIEPGKLVGSFGDPLLVQADTQPPVITLLGEATVTVEAGSSYTDAGATAEDNLDGDITSLLEIVTTVDIGSPGEYTVTYNVVDSAGNAADSVARIVRVVDTTPPVITLLSEPEVTIDQGSKYVDAGATAKDSLDGDLTAKIVVSGSVDIWQKGTYVIHFNVSDAAGNAAETVSRTVTVQPVIQTFSLKSGWNLVSFYVEMEDMNPATVFASIMDQPVQIKNLTRFYDSSMPYFLNTMSVLNVKDGFWVKVNEDVSFEVEGVVPEATSIRVRSGWNLVGYPRKSGETVSDELQGLGDAVVQIKNLTDSYEPPPFPPFLNTLSTMVPGLGYWLKVTENGTWTVGDVSGEGSNGRGIMKASNEEGPEWEPVEVYPNLSATVLAQVSVGGKAVSSGSVVGVFVGDELRGMQEVVQANGMSYVTLNVNLEGAERVNYRIWDAESGKNYRVVKTMTLEMGGTYGSAEALVMLDGVASGSGSTIRIVGYLQEPFGFSFGAKEGRVYDVESSKDLRSWGTLKSYNGTGTLIRFEDERDQVFPQIYYRVKGIE
jgi:hypothetical protein